MARRYVRHGLNALVRARKRGSIDGRTAEGRAAQAMREALTTDQGGADNTSAAKLMIIDGAVTEKVWVARIDKAIESFLKKHPSLLENPRGLAQLYGYRERPLSAFLKALGMVGFNRVTAPTKTIDDEFAEDNEDGAT